MKLMSATSLSLTALLALSACGDSNKATDTAQAVKNVANAQGKVVIEKANYISGCGISSAPNIGAIKFPGMQTEYDFANPGFTKKVFYFSDAECKTVSYVVEETGKFDVLGDAKVTQASNINFNFETTKIKVSDPLVLAAFNLVKACGIGDWTADADRDVSTQADAGLCPGKAAPRTASDIVKSQDGVLSMGANSNQDSAKGFPEQFDNNIAFAKIPNH